MSDHKILSRLLSVGLSASLVSGYATLHDMAFYVLVTLNVIAWLLWLLMSKVEIYALRKLTAQPLIMWTLTIAQIAALVYSNHPALAASSLMASVFIYTAAIARLKKEDAQ